jgi:hypothetical protein
MNKRMIPLSEAYDLLIDYFEAQKEENRIFDINDVQEYLANSDKTSLQNKQTLKKTGDALHDFVKAVPFLKEENIGISTALARVVVNLRQLKQLNMEQGIFLAHGHVRMEGGSAIRKLRIEPGSTMLGAKPPMPNVGRELLSNPDGLGTALSELKLSLKGNIADASQDSYARLSGIVDAFKSILSSVERSDFLSKLEVFGIEKSQPFTPPSNSIH